MHPWLAQHEHDPRHRGAALGRQPRVAGRYYLASAAAAVAVVVSLLLEDALRSICGAQRHLRSDHSAMGGVGATMAGADSVTILDRKRNRLLLQLLVLTYFTCKCWRNNGCTRRDAQWKARPPRGWLACRRLPNGRE